MAAQTSSETQQTAVPEQPAQTVNQPPEKSPYDDLLCTICNLKACWMTPEAAGKASPSSG